MTYLKPEHAGIRILLVDDDDVDRERVRRYLRGFPEKLLIAEANSLALAVKALAQSRFDAVIADGNLGDGQGLEIVAHLGGRNNNICPVILITGFSTEREAVRAMRTGVYDYIPKHELSAETLLNVISNGLQWSQAQANIFEAERELRYRSLYDTLTGLPNRSLFFDRLEHACANARRYQVPFAVMMMDLDKFKEVNDTLGHAAGDEVLQHVGKRLAAACRNSDTVSRLAGDEFAAICSGVDSPESAITVAEKFLVALSPPIVTHARALNIGASIGIALCPLHGSEAGLLMPFADKAMYRAKAGTHKIFCMENAAGFIAPSAGPMLGELDQAMDNREFLLFYQPKINMETEQMIGVEALMRWRKPGGTVVEPDRFIPVLERSNLLAKFTRMSIDLVLSQMADWAARGIVHGVALNISARMLEDASLASYLVDRLAQYRIAASQLTLEITETAIIANPEAARMVAKQISDIGIKLSIDDFGAGFTSFNYLREFSIPEIKIDKNFIIGLKPRSFGASLVKCISTFCESEGIRLVAEGVEERESWALLCELGCSIGQGYSIARPASAGDFEKWLQASKSKNALF